GRRGGGSSPPPPASGRFLGLGRRAGPRRGRRPAPRPRARPGRSWRRLRPRSPTWERQHTRASGPGEPSRSAQRASWGFSDLAGNAGGPRPPVRLLWFGCARDPGGDLLGHLAALLGALLGGEERGGGFQDRGDDLWHVAATHRAVAVVSMGGVGRPGGVLTPPLRLEGLHGSGCGFCGDLRHGYSSRSGGRAGSHRPAT